MEVTLPGVVPYLPSLEWMRDAPAFSGMPAREYTRTLIESNSGEGMVLTVPVEGGSSAAKRLPPQHLSVSSHGEWQRIHLGAMEAAYGREPFFRHFFPALEAVIGRYPAMLAEMNARLLEEMLTALDYGPNMADIRDLRQRHPGRCSDISTRLAAKVSARHSLVESLFRLGIDTLFLLP